MFNHTDKIYLIIIPFILSNCIYRVPIKTKKIVIHSCSLEKPTQTKKSENKPQITVFVHGTKLILPPVDKLFFHCKSGFHKAQEIRNLLVHGKIAFLLDKSDPDHYPMQHFYFNCWSGKLDFKEREEAARALYKNLTELIEKYQKEYGERPYLRVIGHSHGCNVILDLSAIKPENSTLSIDQLILLACPVQKATQHLIMDPMFNSVYSLYSMADPIQVLDPQGLYTYTRKKNIKSSLFSQRRFNPNSKLKQVQIKLNRRAPGHKEFIFPHMIKALPSIINAMDEWNELDNAPIEKRYMIKVMTK